MHRKFFHYFIFSNNSDLICLEFAVWNYPDSENQLYWTFYGEIDLKSSNAVPIKYIAEPVFISIKVNLHLILSSYYFPHSVYISFVAETPIFHTLNMNVVAV